MKIPKEDLLITDTHRHCTKCFDWKANSEFGKNLKGPGGLHRRCKLCINETNRAWHAADPEARKISRRRSNAKNRYGEAGLVLTIKIQEGHPCEVCGGITERMAVDHHHESGSVRGILCSSCNTALGLLKEDYGIMVKLIAYYVERTPLDEEVEEYLNSIKNNINGVIENENL